MARTFELNRSEKMTLRLYSHDIEVMLYLIALHEMQRDTVESLKRLLASLTANFNKQWKLDFPSDSVQSFVLLRHLLSLESECCDPVFLFDGSLFELCVGDLQQYNTDIKYNLHLEKLSSSGKGQEFWDEQKKLFSGPLQRMIDSLHYPVEVIAYFLLKHSANCTNKMIDIFDEAGETSKKVDDKLNGLKRRIHSGIVFFKETDNATIDDATNSSKQIYFDGCLSIKHGHTSFGFARNLSIEHEVSFSRYNQIPAYLEGLEEYFLMQDHKRTVPSSEDSYKRKHKNIRRVQKHVEGIKNKLKTDNYLRQRYERKHIKANITWYNASLLPFFPLL